MTSLCPRTLPVCPWQKTRMSSEREHHSTEKKLSANRQASAEQAIHPLLVDDVGHPSIRPRLQNGLTGARGKDKDPETI